MSSPEDDAMTDKDGSEVDEEAEDLVDHLTVHEGERRRNAAQISNA